MITCGSPVTVRTSSLPLVATVTELFSQTLRLSRFDLFSVARFPNPVNENFNSLQQIAGIRVGDTLQKLGGVPLGSYKDGIEMFKKQRGDVVLTIMRQIGAN